MFKNILKASLRSLLRRKLNAVVSVSGLAMGLTCCLLIFLFVTDELAFDRHHENADRIFRIVSDIRFGTEESMLAVAPAPLAEAFEREIPGIAAAARFRDRGSFLVGRGARTFKEENVVFADRGVFEIFTIPLLSGSAETILKDPNSLVLNRSAALKYFPEGDPVGKILRLDDEQDFRIDGVFEDMPRTSHFHFDFIVSMEHLDQSRNGAWYSNNFQTYILLKEGASPGKVESVVPALVEKYLGPQVEELFGASYSEMVEAGNHVRYTLQPLTDIHLRSDLIAEFEPNGSVDFVYLFSGVAIVILIIACTNFMNLATAQAVARSKEIAVRKVLGSDRFRLVLQFLTEAVVVSFVSLLLAVGLTELLLPQFNLLTGKGIQDITALRGWLGILPLIAIVVGLMSGSYPALVLSGLRPGLVLGGKTGKGRRAGFIRNLLVVFQFSVAVALIAGTLVIRDQMSFIHNKKLGFEKEHVLVIHDAYGLGNQLAAFQKELEQDPAVKQTTLSGFLPVKSNRADTGFWPGSTGNPADAVSMQIWKVDFGYLETMGMTLSEGRNFSEQLGSDEQSIILNREAADRFGFNEAIGQQIQTFAYIPGKGVDRDSVESYTVVGVIDDFHFSTFKDNIGALGLKLGRSASMLSVRFETDDIPALVGRVDDKWRAFAPNLPFEFSFLDQRFDSMYRAEQKSEQLLFGFSIVAIFITCFGLFGLASFVTEERTKEIGIRKVLGASVTSILMMVSRQFILLVLISNLLALPFAYFIGSRWLTDFAYRTEIGASIFIFSAMLSTGVALVTISYRAFKAAWADPVVSLRYE